MTAARPSRGSRNRVVLLVAVLMLAAIGAGVAVGSGLIKLPGLSREPLPALSVTATPTATATAISPTPTVTATASASTQPSKPLTLAAAQIVQSVVDGLAVRVETGVHSSKLGSLAAGQQAFVIGGPRQVDGYDWYRLSGLGLPRNSGCTGEEPTDPFGCPVWSGWVAAASLDGTPWLTPSAVDCPPRPLTPAVITPDFTPIRQLACYGNTPLIVRGYWPAIPPDGYGGTCAIPDDFLWIGCNLGLAHLAASADAPFLEDPIFILAVPPDVTMPEPEQWLEVIGHYDDPIAEECLFGDDPGSWVISCRTQFVVDVARPVAPPV